MSPLSRALDIGRRPILLTAMRALVSRSLRKRRPRPKGPSSFDMAKAAILAHRDRTGSSLQAIKMYISTGAQGRGGAAQPQQGDRDGRQERQVREGEGLHKLAAAEKKAPKKAKDTKKAPPKPRPRRSQGLDKHLEGGGKNYLRRGAKKAKAAKEAEAPWPKAPKKKGAQEEGGAEEAEGGEDLLSFFSRRAAAIAHPSGVSQHHPITVRAAQPQTAGPRARRAEARACSNLTCISDARAGGALAARVASPQRSAVRRGRR